MRIGIDCRIAHYTPGGTGVYTRRLTQALADLLAAEREGAKEDMDCRPGVRHGQRLGSFTPALSRRGGRGRSTRSDQLILFQAAKARDPLVPGTSRRTLHTPSHHRWEPALLPLELLPHRLDVLHSPDFIPPFVRRCRSVITVHDLAFLRWPEHLTAESRRYFNGHISRAVRSADAIIAVSQATKRDLVELVGAPADKVSVVYEAAGFELHPPRKAETTRWLQGQGLPGDYVLFVGTFEPRKNLPRLIEAFAQVRSHGYAGKLLLVGSQGWLAGPTMEAVARHEGGVLVRELAPAELPYLYGGARALAWPSLYEGFGLPVLEAMSCATPVLTSNVSSLPEIAGDAALLVDPVDVDAIAAGLQRLLDDETLCDELRARGIKRAAEFSWRRAAEQTLDVYHRLA